MDEQTKSKAAVPFDASRGPSPALAGHTYRDLSVVFVVGIVLFFANLGGPRLWDRDEPRNAGCAREMLQRGDWVVPTFNAELRAHKPVLLYWCTMAAYSLFGVGEFTARLTSALCGLGTLLLTYAMARRLFGPREALWSAVCLGTSLMFCVAARAATPDSLLVFCITGALAAFVLGVVAPGAAGVYGKTLRPMPLPYICSLYAMLGLAVLAKGPVGVVLPAAIVGLSLWLLWELPSATPAGMSITLRDYLTDRLSWRHLTSVVRVVRPMMGMLIVLAVAAPWYVWVGIRTGGEFNRIFFLDHNLGRAISPMDGHDGPSLLFYPAAMMLGFSPWSVFIVPALMEVWAVIRHRGSEVNGVHRFGVVFAFCWAAVFIGCFSAAQTKLPSYITPCYPALALVAGMYLQRWFRGIQVASNGWMIAGFALLGCIGIGTGVAAPVAFDSVIEGTRWLGWLGVPIVLANGMCIWLAARGMRQRSAAVQVAGAVAVLTTLFAVAAPYIDSQRRFEVVIDRVKALPPDANVVCFGVSEPSWIFYAERPLPFLSADESARIHQEEMKGSPRCLVITTKEHASVLANGSSSVLRTIATTPYFLEGTDLVLLDCTEPAERTATPGRKLR